MPKFPEPEPAVGHGHASAEERVFWREDVLLRRAGFRIRSRPRRGPVLWEKSGRTYTQQQALAEARR